MKKLKGGAAYRPLYAMKRKIQNMLIIAIAYRRAIRGRNSSIIPIVSF